MSVEAPTASDLAPHDLEFVSDTEPGIRRQRSGRGFVYFDEHGRRVRSPTELARIRQLAVPPAWQEVWICGSERGHLQATGWDARGRKQYRYHARWRELRDRAKFDNLAGFGLAIPQVRRAVQRDLAGSALTEDRVIAAVVDLLDRTLVRVGNERYVAENGTFGLTTVRSRHVTVGTTTITFSFRAKGGVRQRRVVRDSRLATVVRRCQELPGQVLFQYVRDDGRPQPVRSGDVNRYLATTAGMPLTAKDFRTWGANVSVAAFLAGFDPPETKGDLKRIQIEAIAAAATRLGNTVAVCRKSYIHPDVLTSFETGALQRVSAAAVARRERSGLQHEEAFLVELVRSWTTKRE